MDMTVGANDTIGGIVAAMAKEDINIRLRMDDAAEGPKQCTKRKRRLQAEKEENAD